jgi:hypothetical protein
MAEALALAVLGMLLDALSRIRRRVTSAARSTANNAARITPCRTAAAGTWFLNVRMNVQGTVPAAAGRSTRE